MLQMAHLRAPVRLPTKGATAQQRALNVMGGGPEKLFTDGHETEEELFILFHGRGVPHHGPNGMNQKSGAWNPV